MGSREISAAWLVAAAILGLFGWLQLAGVHSGSVPLANDLSRRAPIALSTTGVTAAEPAEPDRLASGVSPYAPGDREERICGLDRSLPLC